MKKIKSLLGPSSPASVKRIICTLCTNRQPFGYLRFHSMIEKNAQKKGRPHLNIFAWQKCSNIFLNIFCHFPGCIWFQPMCASSPPPSTEKSIPQHGLLPSFISGIPITRRVLTLSSNCEGEYLFLLIACLIPANTCCMPRPVPHVRGVVFCRAAACWSKRE